MPSSQACIHGCVGAPSGLYILATGNKVDKGTVQVDVLVELGLRVSVGPAVLLDAAKGLDAQKPADDAVRARAGALLTQLDALAYEEARGTTKREHLLLISTAAGWTSQPTHICKWRPTCAQDAYKVVSSVSSTASHLIAASKGENGAVWSTLQTLAWCPVLTEPPAAGMPWPSSELPLLSPPKLVRSPGLAG